MLKSMHGALGLLLKLALSLAAVAAFLVLSAKVPYLSKKSEPVSWESLSGVEGMTGKASSAALQDSAPALIAFPDENALFNGHFQLEGDGQGFATREVEVDGPCIGAGTRYLQQTCPDCGFVDSPAQPGQPATILWMSTGAGQDASGSIFRDCTQDLHNGSVRVVMLEFQADAIDLQGSPSGHVDMYSAMVPTLPGSERVSVMTLGEWSIVVDESDSPSALLMMESKLLAEGWQRVEGEVAPASPAANQRTYKRGKLGLCVVTETVEGDQRQLVTMTNGL